MRLLLDTQILIWWLLDDPRLRQPTRALMAIHPRSPFDRLLIAQARMEGLMAVSADAHWPAYDLHLHRA